jgi:hypothetical protein
MCKTNRKLVNFVLWERDLFNNIVYKSKTGNMSLEIRERDPFSKLARNTSRKLVERRCTGSMSVRLLR